MKPLDLVRLTPEHKKEYKGIFPEDGRFVFLGEISQMPSHGLFVLIGKGVVFAGYHIDSFEVVPEDET